jgi:ribonuclease BN (tRNA processing enzyme)
MKIRLLGTGTPTPSLKRMSSSYLIETGKDNILFDFGSGAYHRMMESGIKAVDISHIFFSHLHYDHCVDYPRLMLTRWDQAGGIVPELKVFGPEPLYRFNRLLFSPEGAFGDDIKARTNHPASIYYYHARGGSGERPWPSPEVKEIKHGDVIEAANWTVRAAEVLHQQPYLKCLAYRIDSPQGSLTYSGDTGYPCKALTELATDSEVLVHMCHWISGTSKNATGSGHLEAAKAARDANVKTLVLSHFTEQLDVPGIKEKLVSEIMEVFKGNVIWGEDLMEIPLAPPQPRKLD